MPDTPAVFSVGDKVHTFIAGPANTAPVPADAEVVHVFGVGSLFPAEQYVLRLEDNRLIVRDAYTMANKIENVPIQIRTAKFGDLTYND